MQRGRGTDQAPNRREDSQAQKRAEVEQPGQDKRINVPQKPLGERRAQAEKNRRKQNGEERPEFQIKPAWLGLSSPRRKCRGG